MLTEQLTPKELVYKHIFNLSHIITDEEFKNVRVGFLYNEMEEAGLPELRRQTSQNLATFDAS